MSSAAPHVFTLTGNLLAERTLAFSSWAPGRTQRASAESFQVGGKGINVSKMLARLRVANTALCFTGGAPGAECEAWLRDRGFAFQAFANDRPTRTGTVIRGGGYAETTFLGADVPPSPAAVQALAAFLDAQPSGQILAVCGSLPGWTEPAFDPLRAALGRWFARGPVVVDTYGPPLGWFATQPAALVKINADEFRALHPEAAQAFAGTLQAVSERSAVRRWVISDGPGQVWLARAGTAPESLTPPTVQEISATGSGDVLLAVTLQGLFLQALHLPAAVARALPYASANAAHPGIAEFPLPT